jgi:hypothetical protein
MTRVNRLIWNHWNKEHIARHGVVPEEVDQVCESDFKSFDGKKGRLIVIGLTEEGRVIAAVLDPEFEAPKGTFYPVTARAASRSERRKYLAEKGGRKKNDK